jgi:long-chain acyl-CoA synthetase
MEEHNIQLTFPALFNDTVRKYGSHNSYAFVGEKPKTYNDSAREISALTAFLEKTGIQPGDKVAILSNNMPNWSSAYFSITFMGAVVVPILPDFSSTEVGNVLSHSESRAVFVSSSQLSKLEGYKSEYLKTGILIEDFSLIFSGNKSLVYDPSARPEKTYTVAEDDLASIIYTSGTTGRSKGVMLTHKNISFNAIKVALFSQSMKMTDFCLYYRCRTLREYSWLILPILGGACVYYLRNRLRLLFLSSHG